MHISTPSLPRIQTVPKSHSRSRQERRELTWPSSTKPTRRHLHVMALTAEEREHNTSASRHQNSRAPSSPGAEETSGLLLQAPSAEPSPTSQVKSAPTKLSQQSPHPCLERRLARIAASSVRLRPGILRANGHYAKLGNCGTASPLDIPVCTLWVRRCCWSFAKKWRSLCKGCACLRLAGGAVWTGQDRTGQDRTGRALLRSVIFRGTGEVRCSEHMNI
ncbi:hypothetical protein BKA80DRAFT_147928 [Phyllosticta citrichinensis]